jgi:hypothetical protein
LSVSDEPQSVDDLSYDWEEDGRQVRRELDRRVLSRGGWPTVMYLYQELDPATDAWRPAKVALVRYQSRRGMLRKHASITLGEARSLELASALETWFGAAAKAERGEVEVGGEGEEDGEG